MTGKAELERTLDLPQAIGLAITMVVGSGLLMLPGLAYIKAGDAALYAWLIAALATAPLLVVFANLGAAIPGAGGVAGFVRETFGPRAGIACEFLVLGTFTGAGGLIITGGQYLAALVGAGGLSPTAETLVSAAGAGLVLLLAWAVNHQGARLSGRLQQILAAGLVALAFGVAASALWRGEPNGTGVAPIASIGQALPAVSLVFFAYVGFELMAFMTGEFRNPKRDFPLMIGLSFGLIVALYVIIALAVQVVLPLDDPSLSTAPFAALLGVVAGEASARVVSAIGIAIAVANVVSVVWAHSRLVFSSAREGLLPGWLGALSGSGYAPQRAVATVSVAFALVAAASYAGLISQATLFELAGNCFFLAYILSVLAYIKRAQRWPRRAFGIATLAFVSVVFLSFGWGIVYPLAMLGIGWILGRQERSEGRLGGHQR